MRSNAQNHEHPQSPHARPNPIRVDQIRSQVVRRPARGRTSTVGKIASASLATMTCIGLAGVLAVRAAEESAAAPTAADSSTSSSDTQGTSSTGLTQDQLDAYARQLDDEAKRLSDYRQQLIQVAGELQAAAQNQGLSVRSSTDVGQSTRQVKPQPAAQPPASPAQGQTQGS